MATFERQIHSISMRAVDELSERLADAEDLLGGQAAKLARKWKKLDDDQKAHIIELCFGAGAAIAAAVSAIAKAEKGKRGKKAAKVGKAALAEAVSAVRSGSADLSKLKKKAKKLAK